MTERLFRIYLGAVLLLFLVMDWTMPVYAYISLLLFEGITNLRTPIILSRWRYGLDYQPVNVTCDGQSSLDFEAERMVRIVVALMLIVSYVLFYDVLWIVAWFVATMLLMAGLTNICPMVMMMRLSGLR